MGKYQLEQTPLSMRQAERWLLHKPNKVPCNRNGVPIDATNPANHLTFEEALSFLLTCNGMYGLGFALGGGWQGIDLDNVEANGLQALANSLPGYVEYSPSGHGCHAIGYGRPFAALKLKGIEAYSGARYFTVTGNAIGGELCDLAPFVAAHLEPLRARPATSARLPPPSTPSQADADIVGTLLANPRHAALYGGTIGDRSASQADMDLCNVLALLGCTPEQAERIWLASRLGQRDKTQSRPEYRQWTVETAFDRVDLPRIDMAGVTANGKPLPWNKPPQVPSEAPVGPALHDAGDWAGQMYRPRRYVIEPHYPCGTLTYFEGEGGAGKSLLTQQDGTCIATGTKRFNQTVMQGLVLGFNCEDDLNEAHRRQADINAALGVTMEDLKGKLYFAALNGSIGNELVTFDPQGRMQLAPAFHWLEQTIRELKPVIVFLDNVAHLFAGNENIRNQVAAFLGLLNALAAESGAAIVLIGHPNKEGKTSGSSAWTNQIRNKIRLSIPTDSDGNVIDYFLRVLSVEKANYSDAGRKVEFRWHNGAFVLDNDLPQGMAETLNALAQEQSDNNAFLGCLDTRNRQKRGVSEKRSSTYAPTIFSQMADSGGIGKRRLEAAMERLFLAGVIERGFLWRDAGEGKDRHGLRRSSANGPADGPPTAPPTVRQPTANDTANAANTHSISIEIEGEGPVGPSPPSEKKGGSAMH